MVGPVRRRAPGPTRRSTRPLGALGPWSSVERVAEPSARRWQEGRRRPPLLEAAVFDRTLDVGWRRASYSSITGGLHDQLVVGSEPEHQLTSDEDVPVAAAAAGAAARRATTRSPLLLADMPGGAWWAR